MAPCKAEWPFAHMNEAEARRNHYESRFDNFYNGYNEDCTMIRCFCYSPFYTPEKKCCGCCCKGISHNITKP